MKRTKMAIAMTIMTALVLFVFRPAVAMAAVEAPSKVVAYLRGTGEYDYSSVEFEVRGMKISEQIKISSVKSSNKKIATIERLYSKYYASNDRAKDSYCRISCLASKEGTVDIKYTVGKTEKTTKLVIKKYENPIKKITLSGVNDGKDFSSLSAKRADVYGEWNDETMKNESLFTVEEAKDPVLHVEPASGWSISEVYLYFDDGLSENFYRNSGKPYKGAQDFVLYRMDENAQSLGINLINKDGGMISVNYELRTW